MSQAVSLVHAVAQSPAAQRYPALQATDAPEVQTPLPLQVPVLPAWWVASGQGLWLGVHVLPVHISQAPAPLHLPSVPHELLTVAAHRPCGSAVPAATARQMPSTLPVPFARLQAMHAPQVAVPQQTPSTQCPLAQA